MTKRGLVGLGVFAAAAAVFLVGFGTLEGRCQTQQNTYRAQTAKQNARSNISEFAFDRSWLPCLVESVTADSQPKDASEKERRDLAAQEATAGIAFWVALIAFFQLGATVWGLLYIRGTLKATLAAVEDTSEATAAMKQQNTIAEDTARRQLRAYVLAKDHQVVDFRPDGTPTFALKIHNFGQTPASEVRCRSLVRATGGDPEDYRMFFREARKSGGLSSSVIGPDDFHLHTNGMEDVLNREYWEMFAHGGMKMIFAGVVSYRDAFGKRHLTTFKYFLQIEPRFSQMTQFDLCACGNGNNAN